MLLLSVCSLKWWITTLIGELITYKPVKHCLPHFIYCQVSGDHHAVSLVLSCRRELQLNMSVVLFNYQSFHRCHALMYSVSGVLFDSKTSVNEATPVSVLPYLVILRSFNVLILRALNNIVCSLLSSIGLLYSH